jgi:hypothetical protein
MDSDDRREGQPPAPESPGAPPRVQPPGPSMEEWHATLEREITARMPFPSKAAEAHFADRRWNGPGVYGAQGRRAASMLRAEYVSDQDLVADRWRLPAFQVGAEGLHVRIRPGTTGIPEQLCGCPITVEYVDLPSRADVAAAWPRLEPTIHRLRAEQPGCISGWDTVWIRLAPWAVPVAEELQRQFGDLVELTVGRLRYPPDRQPAAPPMTRELPQLLDPGEAEVELDGHAVVSSGHTLWHGLRLHNRSDRGLHVETHRYVTADVVDPGTGEIVGGYAGFYQAVAVGFTAAPGRSTRIPLLIDTASSTPRLGYAVPPGHWGLQVTLTLGGLARLPSAPSAHPHPAADHHRPEPDLPALGLARCPRESQEDSDFGDVAPVSGRPRGLAGARRA